MFDNGFNQFLVSMLFQQEREWHDAEYVDTGFGVFDPRLQEVSAALRRLETPSVVLAHGDFELFPPPVVHIDSFGDVCVPMTDTVAKAIITQSKSEAVHSAGSFSVKNSAWQPFVETIVKLCLEPLGVKSKVKVEAKLSKLVVEEVGDNCEVLLDREKDAGAFATLVLVLPGEWEGGELVHSPTPAFGITSDSGDGVRVWDTATKNPTAIKYGVFFDSCAVDTRLLTKGARLSLVYSLVWGSSNIPSPKPIQTLASYKALKAALSNYFDKTNNTKRQHVNEEGPHTQSEFDITDPECYRQAKFVFL